MPHYSTSNVFVSFKYYQRVINEMAHETKKVMRNVFKLPRRIAAESSRVHGVWSMNLIESEDE